MFLYSSAPHGTNITSIIATTTVTSPRLVPPTPSASCIQTWFGSNSAINVFFIPTQGASAGEISMQEMEANSLLVDFFQIKPFSSDRENFSFYFLNFSPSFSCEIGSETCPDYAGLQNIAETMCNASGGMVNQVIVFKNSRSGAGLAGNETYGYGSIFFNLNDSGITLAHEMAHTFGFGDEYYGGGTFGAVGLPLPANLDVEGCPKWCSGTLNTSNEFYPIYEGWKNCVVSKGLNLSPTKITVSHTNGTQLWNSCWNEWAENYYEAANPPGYANRCPFVGLGGGNGPGIINSSLGTVCGNPEYLQNLNLGTGCMVGTGCYFTAYGVNEWRQQQDSIMRTEESGSTNVENASFGAYSEMVLQERIDSVISDRSAR